MATVVKLFEGIKAEKLPKLLTELNAVQRSYGCGQIILQQGESIDKLGIVKSGSVDGVHYNPDGEESLISHFEEGKVFADFLAVSGSKKSPVCLRTENGCEVVFIPIERLFNPHPEYEREAKLMLANLVGIYAKQYFDLQDRMFCITAPTLKEKIYRLLSLYAEKQGSNHIVLPYNRERMATYLNADRSALSRELARMKNEGLIDGKGNTFIIKKEEK